jgi:hypothetical protein
MTAAVLLVALVAPATVHGYSAVQNKADYTEIRIVPAPGPVQVDGKLDDWDLSGAILMCIDEASKAAYQIRVAMMYDKEHVYISGAWKDPTPMVNQYAFDGDVGSAWNADAIQMRFVSNPEIRSRASTMTGARMDAEEQKFVNHITLWYSTRDRKAGYQACYTLGYKDQALNPEGVQGVFVKDADGTGCTFEYRIPLAVLRAPRPYRGGDAVQMQFNVHWGNDQGTELRTGITDVRNPDSNDLGYMGPNAWGLGRFMDTGNLPPAQGQALARADGHIPVAFSLEKDGKASLLIRDATGRTVRTGFGALPCKAGAQTWMWDGLDDFDQPVPAGTYEARILTHEGIGQKYVCNVGMSGTPTWQTEDGRGGWAGDYWEPTYVAVAGDRVVLGTANAEAQKPTICTDLDGNKLYGTAALGLALAVRDGFGYFSGRGTLAKFSLEDGRLAGFADGRPTAKIPAGKGLVALDGATLASVSGANIVLIDLASGAPKAEVATSAPLSGGLAADAKGALYAVSGNSVGVLDTKTGAFTALASDLDEPRMLACDAAGALFVSLQGKTMQVWKLDASGKPARKFGKAGGRPALGAFDPAGMLKPYAIAVDKRDRLWVCENDREPKRYSVWNADGTLWKEFFGSWPYSTAGYFDPQDPENFYALAVRYKVDYDQGTWKTDANILRPRAEEGVEFHSGNPAHPVEVHRGGTIVVRDGRKFLFTGGQLYEETGGAWVPRIAYYHATTEVAPAGKKGKARKGKQEMFWLDADNDGKVQAGEQAPVGGRAFIGRSRTIDAHLNLYDDAGDSWTEPRAAGRCTTPIAIRRLAFLGFGPRGELRYADAFEPVVEDKEGGAVNGIAVDPDGSVYALISGGLLARGERAQGSGSRVVKYSPQGRELWRYTNVHVGFAWTSSTYTPGFLAAAFRLSSCQHPDLLPVTGYYGQYFLLDKKEGHFVDALGQDQRSAYTMDHTMVLCENFNGNIVKHPKTGKTYFTGGDCDCRIWEVTGLDRIKRASVKLALDDAMVAQAARNGEQNRKATFALLARNAGGRSQAALKRLAGAAADGKYDEWRDVAALPIGDDKAKPAQVQLGYDDQHLYARFEARLGVPFLNTPTDSKLLFKSGSALELCLTPHLAGRKVGPNNRHPMEVGDLRVLVARTKDGKLIATRYRPKVAAKDKPLAAFFETPSAGREDFDEIAEWNDLAMHYREIPGGCVVEVAIPWSATALKPAAGLKFLLDGGVIYGNEGGTRNATRAMWSDRTPEVNVNNDIPTESRMHPNGWGLAELKG